MSLTNHSKASINVLTGRPVFTTALKFMMLILLSSLGTALRAQTVEIKIVNGRNGRPIADKCMYVWVGNRSNPSSGPLLETQTGANGIISLRLIHEDGKMNEGVQQLACGLAGSINPVAKYGDTISIRSGYASCQSGTHGYSWLARADFPTDEVLQHGVVTENACGKATAPSTPGKVILFVRPLTWWEKLKQ